MRSFPISIWGPWRSGRQLADPCICEATKGPYWPIRLLDFFAIQGRFNVEANVKTAVMVNCKSGKPRTSGSWKSKGPSETLVSASVFLGFFHVIDN